VDVALNVHQEQPSYSFVRHISEPRYSIAKSSVPETSSSLVFDQEPGEGGRVFATYKPHPIHSGGR